MARGKFDHIKKSGRVRISVNEDKIVMPNKVGNETHYQYCTLVKAFRSSGVLVGTMIGVSVMPTDLPQVVQGTRAPPLSTVGYRLIIVRNNSSVLPVTEGFALPGTSLNLPYQSTFGQDTGIYNYHTSEQERVKCNGMGPAYPTEEELLLARNGHIFASNVFVKAFEHESKMRTSRSVGPGDKLVLVLYSTNAQLPVDFTYTVTTFFKSN